MRKILGWFFVFLTVSALGQVTDKEEKPYTLAFKTGEWLEFRLSYSNFFNAGFSTVEIEESTHKNRPVFHIKGHGRTTGLVRLFFKVEDDYQTFIDKSLLKPYHFIRNIDEGGYTKDTEILFDHQQKVATVKDHKHKTEETFSIPEKVQDLLSAFYFLRCQDLSTLRVGEEMEIVLFFDKDTYTFKLKFLGKELIKTKFGKIKSLKFRPLVQRGRVFREEESVEVWISDDQNKMPLRIKASLAVGSLVANLNNFKGLAHPFNIVIDN